MELLERSQYLSGLETALVHASAGAGRIALVSGEAGIGKTSLVRQFVSRQAGGARLLWGSCDLLFTPNPLGPLLEMAPHLPGKIGVMLAGNAARQTIFSAVLEELQKSTHIMIFEDVHWADEATLDLLRFLGRRIASTRSLLILTYREDEFGYQHALRIVLGDLATAATFTRLQLPPLSQEAVVQLVAGRQMDASALFEQTGGNPFFVTEVLASPAGSIPPTVRDAVLARISRLSAGARAVLEVSAVIGQHAPVKMLPEISDVHPDAIDECLASGVILAEGGSVVFRHEIARQTILASLPPQRKHSLHQRVLAALREQPTTPGGLALLAHHAEASQDEEAVLKYAPAAAQHASAAGAFREARILYELALRYASQLPLPEQARLLHAYGRACNLTEDPGNAVDAVRKALHIWRKLENPYSQGDMLSFLTIFLRNAGRNQEAEQANQEAIQLLSPLPASRELSLAYRAQATLRLANRDISEAVQWATRAIELGEQFGDPNIMVMAHIILGSAMLFMDFERGHAYLEDLLKNALESGSERQVANLYAHAGACCAELFQLRRAYFFLAEGSAYTADRGMDIFIRLINGWLAVTQLHLGEWDAANEVLLLLAQNPPRSALNRIPFLVATGLLRARRGDPGSPAALDEALLLAEATGCLPNIGVVRAARCEAAWLAGDLERTRQEAQAAYDLALQKKHPWFAGRLAFWAWRAGEAVRLPHWTALPFALQIAGDWHAAAEAWQQLGCPYEQASALADGDLPARLEALRIYEQLGAYPAAELLRSSLRGTGSLARSPRPVTRQNPFGLTSRQVEVLGLLTENLSNNEIAERLVISPKTVDHHVSAILAALDVHSREEAAAIARQHPHFHEK
jgi:ATP/maltotriose-dependent transcriptional regulator MalT